MELLGVLFPVGNGGSITVVDYMGDDFTPAPSSAGVLWWRGSHPAGRLQTDSVSHEKPPHESI